MSIIRDALLSEDQALRAEFDKNTPKRELAMALRALRKHAGLTQQQVAARSGLTQSRVSKMETPTGPIATTASLNRYADACGSDFCIAFPAKGTMHTRLDGDGFICAIM